MLNANLSETTMPESLLDLPVSFFEYDHKRNTFGNVPSQKTTLRRIVTTKFYQGPVEAICTEPDKAKQDELKKLLPAYTPVALLHHRKKDTSFAEKIQQQWPMLMGDCDKKDNPDVDMAELKKHIARLPYVLLCAYSVRRGLWFVVRLPDGQTPETLAAHYRYLQKLFSEKFGIKLDSTKGGNPTDLRFVSFDAEPFINEYPTVMTGTYTPAPPKRVAVHYGKSKNVDEGTLLKRLVGFVEKAGEGQRHECLLKAAKLAGGYIAADRIDEQNAILALETAASEWPQFSKSQKTIRDGIRYGLGSPLYSDERIVPMPPVRHKTSPPGPGTTPQAAPARPQPIALDTSTIYQRILNCVTPEEPKIIQPLKPSRIDSPQPENKPSTSSRPAIKIPKSIEVLWTQFARPPLPWNKIGTYKALLRCLEVDEEPTKEVVTTIAGLMDSPGAVLKPDESQIERLTIDPVESYPTEWDEPSPPGAIPILKQQTFHVWQCNPESPFNKLGLASLQTN